MTLRFTALTFILTLLAACGFSKPSTFYVLDANTAPRQSLTLKNADSVVIGIEQISIPTYLDRPQIVLRDAETSTIMIAEFHRWAEHISDVMPRVLADAISERAGYPLAKQVDVNREFLKYRLYVEVQRFDATPNGEAVLDAWWLINDADGQTLYRTRSTLVEPVSDTYPSLVKAEQKLIRELGFTIADYYKKNIKQTKRAK